MRSFTLKEVVQRILTAQKPAEKAHATKSLNAYSVQRAYELGSTPERVMAGVRAAVTKRKKSCHKRR